MSPCVFEVRDSVIGHAPVCFQQLYHSDGTLGPEEVLSGVCMWGWRCDAHNEGRQGVPSLRVGGVVCVFVSGGGEFPG